MKSRARASATGLSVGLTISAVVWACTSLPEITAIPTDSGASADGPVTDAGGLSAECRTFLDATGLPGRWALGPLAGSAVTYVESADGDPEIAWVGRCNGATEPTIYRTSLSSFSAGKDVATKGLPPADLCARAQPFAVAQIPLQGLVDIVSLVPSDRNPKFLCALVAGNGVIAYGPSTVGCFSSNANTAGSKAISGNFVGLFRTKEFGPSSIRGAFAGAANAEINTFVAAEGSDGSVVLSPTVQMAQKAPLGSTAAIATTGAANDDSFVVFDGPSAVLSKIASDGTKLLDFPTPGIPGALVWGETTFADRSGIVFMAGLEGPLNAERLRPRVSYLLPSGNTAFQTVTDLATPAGATTYGLTSGGFERFVLVPGTNAPGTGGAVVAVRGMADKTPITAFVFAKAGSASLLPSESKGVRIPALPARYGLAGSISTAGSIPSIYVGLSASTMTEWSGRACTSGMIAAFEPQ